MNEEIPFYKNGRFVLLVVVILLSITSIVSFNIKYGLDLEGGSWLQLQLQGAIVQINASEGKMIQTDFGKLLDDPSIKINEITDNSVTFTTSKETTQKIIDNFEYGGNSSLSRAPDGGTRITIQTNKDIVTQRYLQNNLQAEIIQIPSTGRVITFEIRKAVNESVLNTILNPVDGKVLSIKQGVTVKTADDTKEVLDKKLNILGTENPSRNVDNQYILVDLAGVDMTTARDIAAKPGKFEIRIQVQGNQTEHVLYGDQIRTVDPPLPEKGGYGVPFELSDQGAEALRNAAIQYGAVTNPNAHHLLMYLDDIEIFDAPLAPDLAKNIQSIPVKSMVATTGSGESGQQKAKELMIHLREGALPVKVEVVGAGQVSAELGNKFKEQVVIAGIIALILVAIVIGLRYKQPNIIIPMLATSFSEVIILLGVVAALGISGLRFQLDLATIAGIIAVIGTGVDHLIIITDEVLSGGAMPPGKVYRSRLSRAFTIIFSAAATVGVAMLPLWFMGFGALRGFALITIIGVLIGVFIARPAYAVVIQGMLMVPEPDKKFVDED